MDAACAQCGQVKYIVARQLCKCCYQWLARHQRLDRYPKTGRLGAPRGSRRQVARQHDRIGALRDEIERLQERIKELEAIVGRQRDELDNLNKALSATATRATQLLSEQDEISALRSQVIQLGQALSAAGKWGL